jgi:hypothetical protein
MTHQWVAASLLLLTPTFLVAQETPEDLLPAATQIYLRWDGVDAHRDAYAKTAMGKMMAGDTGKFVANMVNLVQENLGALVTVEQLLKGFSPAKLVKLQTDAAQAPKLFGQLMKHGFLLAGDIRDLERIDGQATLILPNAGVEPGPLFGVIGLTAGLSGDEAQDQKIDGVTVRHWEIEGVHVNCWAAGKHLVLTVGTEPAAAALKRSMAKDTRLSSNPLFRRLHSFNQFETAGRAFVDVEGILKQAKTRGPDVAKLLDDLGLDGIKSVVLYSGFDGDADRGLIEAELAGPRKGLLKMIDGKPFTLAELPPLPHDVTSWSMTRFEATTFYDLALLTAENIVKIVSAEDLPRVKELSTQADQLLDVDLRNELLGALGDRFAMYSSPSDGPLNLGQVFLFQVKDAAKLQSALNKAIKGIGRLTGADIGIAKRDYHGVELREVHVRQQGFFFVPTYVIHKNWLAVSYFPQPVQGFVQRANGELPVWKADSHTEEALAKMPKEFLSVSMTDPRPMVKQMLSVAPVIAGLVKSFQPDLKLDVGSVPNSHEATRHLFPNVSVVTLRDNVLRVESRGSLELPIDLSGIDSYALFVALSFSRFFLF